MRKKVIQIMMLMLVSATTCWAQDTTCKGSAHITLSEGTTIEMSVCSDNGTIDIVVENNNEGVEVIAVSNGVVVNCEYTSSEFGEMVMKLPISSAPTEIYVRSRYEQWYLGTVKANESESTDVMLKLAE